MQRNALGRGLSALIREPEPVQAPPPQPPRPEASAAVAAAPAPVVVPTDGVLQADIDLIDPSPYQPRTHFREESLEELSRSIRMSGIVQPLVVRRIGARFQLIAGERRWRAAQRAGFGRVPVVVRNVPEEKALEMTLVENIQREDLNPIEQARAFQRLMDEFMLTQEQVAERTGKERTTIANAVRLLNLEGVIQNLVEEGRISSGHARALLGIEDAKVRLELARKIARGGLTVRQTEKLAARGLKAANEPEVVQHDANTRAALDDLQRKFGARVLLHPIKGGRPGHLVFEYCNAGELARIYGLLMRE
jgi:ParB family transcriptional regulator, chromosome partitioning protein